MRGRRRDQFPDVISDGEPGDYAVIINADGQVEALWARLPTGSPARLPAIGFGTRRPDGSKGPEWEITVEADATVTVEPSIRQYEVGAGPNHVPAWHGFLRRGEWVEA